MSRQLSGQGVYFVRTVVDSCLDKHYPNRLKVVWTRIDSCLDIAMLSAQHHQKISIKSS